MRDRGASIPVLVAALVGRMQRARWRALRDPGKATRRRGLPLDQTSTRLRLCSRHCATSTRTLSSRTPARPPPFSLSTTLLLSRWLPLSLCMMRCAPESCPSIITCDEKQREAARAAPRIRVGRSQPWMIPMSSPGSALDLTLPTALCAADGGRTPAVQGERGRGSTELP